MLRLRKKHHIIGSLVGSIADNFTQNQLQGLPMLLNHYETAVLVKNGTDKKIDLDPFSKKSTGRLFCLNFPLIIIL